MTSAPLLYSGAMRIGRATLNHRLAIVACNEDRWCDLTDALAALTPPVHSIGQLIETHRLTTAVLAPMFDTAPPIDAPKVFALPLVPSKVVCLGRNYAEHARELGNVVPDEPVLFNKTPNTYLPDGGTVSFDAEIGRVDHEGEIAVVIGPARSVAGYTLLNDVTARDLQTADKARGLPWFRSKNLDGFSPIGPVIRLSDSLPLPPDLEMELRVNGALRQQGNTRQFIFDVPAMVAYISKFMDLKPGDLIATGTPPGVGPLQNGDQVEVFSPPIGQLRSRIRIEPRKITD